MATAKTNAKVAELQARVEELEARLSMPTLTGIAVEMRRWQKTAARPAAISLLLKSSYRPGPDAKNLSLPAENVTVRGQQAEDLMQLMDSLPDKGWVVLSCTGRWRGFGDLVTNERGYSTYSRKALDATHVSVVRSTEDA